MDFSDFLEQCITDCIEGDGPDADLHRRARSQRCLTPSPSCCCDTCWYAKADQTSAGDIEAPEVK